MDNQRQRSSVWCMASCSTQRSTNDGLPEADPILKRPEQSILPGALGRLAVLLVMGLTAQVVHLRGVGRKASALSR